MEKRKIKIKKPEVHYGMKSMRLGKTM
jgi:hypothetical protein